MTFSISRLFSLLLPMLVLAFFSFGQKINKQQVNENTWVNTLSYSCFNKPGSLNDPDMQKIDSLFKYAVLNEVDKGNINPYFLVNDDSSNMISLTELKELFENNKTPQTSRKIYRHNSDYEILFTKDSIDKPGSKIIWGFKIYEKWCYDYEHNKCKIDIVKVAPCIEVLSREEAFLYYIPLFFLNYKDYRTIINKYSLKNTFMDISNAIFQSNFGGYRKLNNDFEFDTTSDFFNEQAHLVSHTVPDHSDGAPYYSGRGTVNNAVVENLSMAISRAIKNGTINAFRNSDNDRENMLSARDIDQIMRPTADTCYVFDPHTDMYSTKYISIPFSPSKDFKVLEKWNFDKDDGQINIDMTSIALLQNVYNKDLNRDKDKTILWLEFSDFKRILDDYRIYCPENDFELRQWRDYFISDDN